MAYFRTALVVVGLGFALCSIGTAVAEDKPIVLLTTSLGNIKIELDPEKAPITAKNFIDYVKAGYYDGTIFHRVIPGFMIKGGGLTSDMRDKSQGQRAPIKNESSNGLKNETGTIAMARTSDPDSATSQFFINVNANAFLNKNQAQGGAGYAVFGRVIEGMDVVRKIERVKTTSKGMYENAPLEVVIIKSAKVVEE